MGTPETIRVKTPELSPEQQELVDTARALCNTDKVWTKGFVTNRPPTTQEKLLFVWGRVLGRIVAQPEWKKYPSSSPLYSRPVSVTTSKQAYIREADLERDDITGWRAEVLVEQVTKENKDTGEITEESLVVYAEAAQTNPNATSSLSEIIGVRGWQVDLLEPIEDQEIVSSLQADFAARLQQITKADER